MTPEEEAEEKKKERDIRIEERADRMIGRLPRLLQAGTNIRKILEVLGGDFEEMELSTRRLLESRWYMLAAGFDANGELDRKALSDLGAIGALFNLRPGRGESDAYFRRHLTELVQLHSAGLSRAKSLLHLVSFAYLAEQPPRIKTTKVEDEQNPEIIRFQMMGQFKVPNGVDQDGNEIFREIEVELVDNPLSSASASFLAVGANQQLAVLNGGLEEAYPNIDIKASDVPIHVPMLHHEESGFDLIFLGVLNENQTLSIRDGEQPLVDGKPTNGKLLVSNPTRFAEFETDLHVYHFGLDAKSCEAYFSICELTKRSLPLRTGENHWHYRTLSKSELEAYLESVPELLNLADEALAQSNAPPAEISFWWKEVTPAAFELRIPANYVPPHYRTKNGTEFDLDYVSFFRDIRAALEYGRAAGVRATVAFNLNLQPEVVTMAETFGMSVDFGFPENQQTTDELTSIGDLIEFVETVDTPNDKRLTFGGVFGDDNFDGTYFDDSWFQFDDLRNR